MSDIAERLVKTLLDIGESLKKNEGKAFYPLDHKPGLKVPKGGSSCASCKYLKDKNKRICGNKHWVEWHGSEIIPEAIDEYCSDFWEWKK